MRVWVLLATVLAYLGAAPMGMAEEKAWLQIEAQPSLTKAKERAAAYAAAFPDVAGYTAGSGWYVVTIGPFLPEAAAARILELRRENLIPDDAFVTDGSTFGEQFWPEGAVPAPEPAAQTAAQPEAPMAEADETPKQARTSEAALTKDERKSLQEALKWYGFYDSTIDGAFGPGTRKSMAAWQEANGLEPTGILTTRERAMLTGNHAADLAEFGFETVSEPEAGIEMTLPLSLVAFDHYEPPFVHFNEKAGSGLRIMMISEPGGAQALAGLYDVLQTLEVVPATGERAKGKTDFTINGLSDTVQSFAYAETRDGMVKGYLAVWKPADAERMTRILPVLKASFRAVGDKALDPGLVPMEEAVRAGLLAGLEVRHAKLARSGFYVDAEGHVLTTTEAVETCAKITIDHDTLADVVSSDATLGLALLKPRSPLAPSQFAKLANASPRIGSEVAVSGYSYEDRLPAPVLTFGTLDAAEGLDGQSGMLRLTAPVLAGDAGGPVLDGTGAVIGMLLSAAKTDKVLPQGVAFAADAASLGTLLVAAGLQASASDNASLASPDALSTAALGMTVLVSCWNE